MKRLAAALLTSALSILGCGEGEKTKTQEISLETKTDSVVVATVNGTPIYDSCIIGHAKESGSTAREALDACIDFELLAQAAAKYQNDPEVADTRRRESVRLLVDREYIPTADDPSDVPTRFIKERVWSRAGVRAEFIHGEYRRWAHALAEATPKDSPERHAAARKLAEEWAAALTGRSVKGQEFRAEVKRIASGRKHRIEQPNGRALHRRSGTVKPFADALFAMKEKDTVSDVVKTRFGYHVILLVDVEEAENRDFKSALPELRTKVYGKWRQLAFHTWAERKVKKSPDKVSIAKNRDELLQKVKVDVGGVAIGGDNQTAGPK